MSESESTISIMEGGGSFGDAVASSVLVFILQREQLYKFKKEI